MFFQKVTPSTNTIYFDANEKEYRPWAEKAKQITLLAAKILLFPWGLYCGAKYLTQRIVMVRLYPGQSRLGRWLSDVKEGKDPLGEKTFTSSHQTTPAQQRRVIKKVSITYHGETYSGYTSTPLEGDSEKLPWLLHATGYCGQARNAICDATTNYALDLNCNVLVLDAPGIGESSGTATYKTMGLVQHLGLRFLEEQIKATTITGSGWSMGASALCSAIQQHTFKAEITYKMALLTGFNKASIISSTTIGTKLPKNSCLQSWLPGLVRAATSWSAEMDNEPALQILKDKNIPTVIVRHQSMDGTIPLCARLANTKMSSACTRIYEADIKEANSHRNLTLWSHIALQDLISRDKTPKELKTSTALDLEQPKQDYTFHLVTDTPSP